MWDAYDNAYKPLIDKPIKQSMEVIMKGSMRKEVVAGKIEDFTILMLTMLKGKTLGFHSLNQWVCTDIQIAQWEYDHL